MACFRHLLRLHAVLERYLETKYLGGGENTIAGMLHYNG